MRLMTQPLFMFSATLRYGARLFAHPSVRAIAIIAGAAVVTGCQVSELATAKHMAPVPSRLERKISSMGMRVGSPIMLRIYKEESELEVWKETRTGDFKLLTSYDICAWSGELGPKKKEGDRQAPEGFYTVTPGQMNPNSSYHLAFNLGFPNAFDRSHGRTGSHLMVHGDCSSRGCYAMEDEQIQEIYALAREAFDGGQRGFQVQAFPFRMTPENMARHAEHEHFDFWQMLKEGSDHFEATKRPPKISVCDRRYVFNASPASGSFRPRRACPDYSIEAEIEQLVAEKRESDLKRRMTLIARAERSEERRERWEEREKAIAAFFDTGPSAQSAPEDADTPNETAPSGTVAAVPVPRAAPRKLNDGDDAPAGLRFGLFGGGAASAQAFPQTAVSSTAGTTQPAPSRTAEPEADRVADVGIASAPLGYAAEDDGSGFLSGVAQGGKSLWGRATSLFD